MLEVLIVIVAAYLIGSLSFAVILSRAFGMPDPRSYGSGNPARPMSCAAAASRWRH
jgi:glycerol-3-phosphate acyltransferase PlsY